MNTKDLVSLFKWNTKVDIKNRDGKTVTTVHIRLVGDVDYNQAQAYGLVASRKLRKLLKDPNSVENQSLFLDLEDRTKEELIPGVLMTEIYNFREAALEDLGDEVEEFKLPDNPTLEDKERQQEFDENAPKEKAEKIRAKMEEKSNERKVELDKLSIEELRPLFVEGSINFRCLEEFSVVFKDYCIFAGAYKDANFKEKAFTDFEDFRNISTNLKKQVSDAYLQLELSGEQLKN